MALNVQALNDAVAKLGADLPALATAVNTLVATHTDPAAQQAVDAATTLVGNAVTTVEALTATVNAALTPAS